MATLPAKLKSAGVQPFATRAQQLEKYRPIISYWCEYYVLQQILSKQLHTADNDCQNYAIQLMDKLEATKVENASNDAIVDDVAAKAYVENFALETFGRAEAAQRANSVTRQTADTFQAAATFIDLLTIWGPLDQDLAAKSKFAKYHAVRIAKAIKAGDDPNASNPPVEPDRPSEQLDDGVDAELKALEEDRNHLRPGSTSYHPPTVESAPDSFPSSPPVSTPQPQDAELAAPVPPPIHTLSDEGHTMSGKNTEHDVSPIEPEPGDVADRTGSVGGGYFPAVPNSTAGSDAFMSDADQAPQAQDPPFIPPQSLTPHEHSKAVDFYSTGLIDATSPPAVTQQHVPLHPFNQQPASSSLAATPIYQPASSQPVTQTTASSQLVDRHAIHTQNSSNETYRTDDESVLDAQKHAKWAISALHFEDVNTAVKELRIALKALGAI